jgi:hypothetical protein
MADRALASAAGKATVMQRIGGDAYSEKITYPKPSVREDLQA